MKASQCIVESNIDTFNRFKNGEEIIVSVVLMNQENKEDFLPKKTSKVFYKSTSGSEHYPCSILEPLDYPDPDILRLKVKRLK